MFEWVQYFQLHRDFSQAWFTHVIDMVVVFFIIYEILKLVRDTRAVQMAAGIAVVAFLYVVARWMHLDTLLFLMRNATLYVGFGIIVLFQAEIRAALTHFGKNLRNPFSFSRNRKKKPIDSFDEIILATTTFSAQKIGALIVFERTVGLQDHINRGVRLDAVLSYDLLVNIFNTNAPLHDGAVIIRNRRIAAASCFLPLTLNPRLSKDLGTRHRAAIGITEESDSFVIVVSEETGVISTVEQGQITRNLDSRKLKHALQRAMDLSQAPAPRRYRRRSFVTEHSIPPESSMSDLSETPPSGIPVLIGPPTSTTTKGITKNLRESGSLNFEAFLSSSRLGDGLIGRMLREYVLKNGKLKFIAALFTVALWLSVVTQQDAIPYSVRGVQVTYQGLAANLVISNRENVEEVTLRVRGPRDVVERLRPESFGVKVALDKKGPGDTVVRLREKDGDAQITLPDGIEILEIFPQRLTVSVERLVDRQVEIKPSFKGDPLPDFKVTEAVITPRFTVLRGPESKVSLLDSVGTETIWLNSRRSSFKEKYKIDVKDPQIEILSPLNSETEVQVSLQPITAIRRIENVEIHPAPFAENLNFSPRIATVEVEGPQNLIGQLTANDITITPQAPNQSAATELSLQGTIANRLLTGIQIKSISPTTVQRKK
ncbi:MAG: diadenylate cyclase CdaA [Blastocatellia bacterium]|nr:diadenylate cyclase CdaA [Blastocatellia bacterium]